MKLVTRIVGILERPREGAGVFDGKTTEAWEVTDKRCEGEWMEVDFTQRQSCHIFEERAEALKHR